MQPQFSILTLIFDVACEGKFTRKLISNRTEVYYSFSLVAEPTRLPEIHSQVASMVQKNNSCLLRDEMNETVYISPYLTCVS